MKLKKSETYRNEIKSDIVRAGRAMTQVVDSLSGRLKRGSLRTGEAAELADALDCDLAWQKRGQS